MRDLLRLLGLGLPGTLRVLSGRGFMVGEVTAAQLAAIPCDAQREGEERRVKASTGVASRTVRCEQNAADAWAWREVGHAALYTAGGTDVALADGGTGASLADPNADRILFWDDSGGAVTWLAAGSGLAIDTTTITSDRGLVKIVDDDFSAVASRSLDGCFTSAYRNYRLVINIDSGTAVANLNMRMRAASSDHSSGNYERGAVLRLTSGTTVTGVNSAAATEWALIGLLNGAVDGCITIDLMNPQNASFKTGGFYESSYLSTATTVYTALSGGLGMRVTTSFDGFSLIASSGNITGKVVVYGYID
jgi:hypothetical protein